MASAWSADCHASGAVNYIATAVKGGMTLTFCGHCLCAPKRDGMSHLDALTADGWEIIPVPRTAGSGVGTESTPAHYAVGRET